MGKSFADWVTGRAYRAGVVAAALTLLPPLGILGSGVLVLTSLQKGATAAWMSAALGTAVLFAVGLVGDAAAAAAGAIGAALLFWAPALALAEVLRKMGRLDFCLQGATLSGLLLVIIWFGIGGETGQSLVASMAEDMKPLLAENPARDHAMAILIAIMPGALAGSLMLAAVLGLMIGMWWHAAAVSPGALGEAFRALRLGRLLGAIGIVILIATLVTGQTLFANLLVVLSAAFVLQGLAVLHGVAALRSWPSGALIAVYLLLMIGMGFTAPALAATGLADTWIDFRGRAGGAA